MLNVSVFRHLGGLVNFGKLPGNVIRTVSLLSNHQRSDDTGVAIRHGNRCHIGFLFLVDQQSFQFCQTLLLGLQRAFGARRPGAMNQQSAQVRTHRRVSRPRPDTDCTARMLPRHQSQKCRQMTVFTELPGIAERSHQCCRIQHADVGHLGQTMTGLASRVLRHNLLAHLLQRLDQILRNYQAPYPELCR